MGVEVTNRRQEEDMTIVVLSKKGATKAILVSLAIVT